MANLQNVNFLKSQLAKSQPEHKMTKMLWLTFSKLTIFHRNNQVFWSVQDEDDIDETIIERLVGLTEMFPESLRRGAVSLVANSVALSKWAYSTSRTVSW